MDQHGFVSITACSFDKHGTYLMNKTPSTASLNNTVNAVQWTQVISVLCGGHRLCWRWSTTCSRSRPTWRRLSGRSCSERSPCCSVNAAPCFSSKTSTHPWDIFEVVTMQPFFFHAKLSLLPNVTTAGRGDTCLSSVGREVLQDLWAHVSVVQHGPWHQVKDLSRKRWTERQNDDLF